MSENINEKLTRFLKSINLKDIKPKLLHSELLGEMPEANSEVSMNWQQRFAEGDPVEVNNDLRIFRPKYDVTVSFKENLIFRHISVFFIIFQVTDIATFDELLQDQEIRKIFSEIQIQKTLWPFLRQQVHDGMSRLGIPPLPLPWLK